MSKIKKLALKLLMQPGRIFLPKGSFDVLNTVDSFSLEYLLLAQEKARLDLVKIPIQSPKSIGKAILFFPKYILLFPLYLIRLFIVNQIVRSLINTNILKNELYKANENSRF